MAAVQIHKKTRHRPKSETANPSSDEEPHNRVREAESDRHPPSNRRGHIPRRPGHLPIGAVQRRDSLRRSHQRSPDRKLKHPLPAHHGLVISLPKLEQLELLQRHVEQRLLKAHQ